MAFETRCPECDARLRFDDEPDADETIECAKCGHQFDLGSAALGGKAKDGGKAKAAKGGKAAVQLPKADKKSKSKSKVGAKPDRANDANVGKKRVVKKKKSNRSLLIFMSLAALVVLSAIGGIGYMLLSKSAKVPEMASCLPAECNIVRGVNAGTLVRYKGFKQEYDRQIIGKPYDQAEALATASGYDSGVFLDYIMIGKKRVGGSIGEIYVYRTSKAVNPAAIIAALNGADAGGYYKVPGRGALGGAAVYIPSPRLVVVVPSGGMQTELIQKSMAAYAAPDASSFKSKLGDLGPVASRAQIWTLIRTEGANQNYIKDMIKPMEQDMKPATDKLGRGSMVGFWASYGASGVRFGMGVEMESADAAYETKKYLQDGELGKGDDAQVPNSVRQSYSRVTAKEFTEFLANMSFRTKGAAGYLESKMGKTKAQQELTTIANPSLGEASSGGGGPAGAGIGAGGRGGP